MRLAPFILANVNVILAEWVKFAGSLESGANKSDLALRDHAEMILRATAKDMQVDQSSAQQTSKSKGHGGADTTESDQLDNASALHGGERVGLGFDIMEVVSEYRALRSSVLRLWGNTISEPDADDLEDISRFNESMDQSLATAVDTYSRRIDQSRLMFLAILSHDMRNPLNSIGISAALLSMKMPDPVSVQALTGITRNTQEITRLITDLIDFASTRLGGTMPLTLEPVDLQEICREVLEGFRIAHPQREILFRPNGDLTGEWDAVRLRQAISNLMGNAFQHGTAEGSVELAAASEGSNVAFSVKNEGHQIPADKIMTIFDPLMRYARLGENDPQVTGSIGLGLYIVREIVAAHGGTVEVVSTASEGTTFTIRLPRKHYGDVKPGNSKI